MQGILEHGLGRIFKEQVGQGGREVQFPDHLLQCLIGITGHGFTRKGIVIRVQQG